jgi:hypothetical protein
MIDVAKILAELKHEKEQLEQAILTLERLADGRGGRRGRQPSWLGEGGGGGNGGGGSAPKRRGRPPGSKNKVHESKEQEPKDAVA